MIPVFIRTNGALTCEQIAPNAFIIRCLVDPQFPLGKFVWVCNLIKDGSRGFVKAFLSLREPQGSEGRSLIKIGRSLGIEECEIEHLDDEGNLVIQKSLWRSKSV